MQVFICFSLKETIKMIFRENAWGFLLLLFYTVSSRWRVLMLLQTRVASCWLDIGIVCHFVYTAPFCTRATEIKLLVWCLRNVTGVFWIPLQCFS